MEKHYHFSVTAPLVVMFAMLFWVLALVGVISGMSWGVMLTVAGVPFVACAVVTFARVQAYTA